MKRSFEELIGWLGRENEFPHGAIPADRHRHRSARRLHARERRRGRHRDHRHRHADQPGGEGLNEQRRSRKGHESRHDVTSESDSSERLHRGDERSCRPARSIWPSPIRRSTSATTTTSTTTARSDDALPRLVAAVDRRRSHRVLKPTGTFWLAIGDEYAAELKVIVQHELGLHAAAAGSIWYYTFGVNCTTEVQPLARPPVPLRQGREAVHVQRRRADPRPLGPAARLRRQRAPTPSGRLPDDTWILRPQDLPDGFHRRRRHLVLPPRRRHVQGAGRLPRLPDARAAPRPHHPRVQQPGRRRARPVRRQRHDAGRREEARPRVPRLRALARLREARRRSG